MRARLLSADTLTCALCGMPIDKTLKTPHPLSPEADHIIPIAQGGNPHGTLQAVHRQCNIAKGDGTRQTANRNSRQW